MEVKVFPIEGQKFGIYNQKFKNIYMVYSNENILKNGNLRIVLVKFVRSALQMLL